MAQGEDQKGKPAEAGQRPLPRVEEIVFKAYLMRGMIGWMVQGRPRKR